MAEWYYIGHYGQLGPLTKEQIDELVEGGVIARDTYVWRTGMADWLPAERVAELQASFRSAEPFAAPPPPPSPVDRTRVATVNPTTPVAPAPFGFDPFPATSEPMYPAFGYVKSDKSRIVGGILNLILPGIGRIYLGYAAIGILQFVLSFCMGVGYIWSLIDGVIMLTGGVKMDGYGRVLPD